MGVLPEESKEHVPAAYRVSRACAEVGLQLMSVGSDDRGDFADI